MQKTAVLSQYLAAIAPLFSDLVARTQSGRAITEATLVRMQTALDKVAKQYQADAGIGKDVYKLYLSQSLIDYHRGDYARAQEFLAEAKKQSVNDDTVFVDQVLANAPAAPAAAENEEVQESDVQTALTGVKSAATKTILKGLGLVVLCLVITIISYNMADSGDSYFVFWGLGIWGLVEVCLGLYRYFNPISVLGKEVMAAFPGFVSRAKAWGAVLAGAVVTTLVSFALLNLFSPTLANEIENGGDFHASYRANFIEACNEESGGEVEGCACIADHLLDNVSQERLVEMEDEAVDAMPSELSAALSACGY